MACIVYEVAAVPGGVVFRERSPGARARAQRDSKTGAGKKRVALELMPRLWARSAVGLTSSRNRNDPRSDRASRCVIATRSP